MVERIQLNLRLDGQRELYDQIKLAATRQGTSINAFVVNAVKAALGIPSEESQSQSNSSSLEAIVERVKSELVATLDGVLAQKLVVVEGQIGELSERLGKLNRRTKQCS